MKKVVKKFIFPIAILTILLLIPSQAHAVGITKDIAKVVTAGKDLVGSFFTDIAASTIGWVVCTIGYIIATVVGGLIGRAVASKFDR